MGYKLYCFTESFCVDFIDKREKLIMSLILTVRCPRSRGWQYDVARSSSALHGMFLTTI